MAVKLRLQRKGRKKAPFYHIVAADARSPRDGRFIEKLGTYNPLTIPATIELNREKTFQWLLNGAQPTDTVRAILRFKGVLYQKHLAEGVKKGAMTEEQAEEKLNAWIAQKEARIAKRREESVEKHRQHIAAVDGTPRVKVKPVVEEAQAPATEEAAPAAEVEETAVAAAEESAPAAEVEEKVVAVVEEAVASAEEAVAEVPAAEEAVVETPADKETPAPAEEEKTEE